MQGPLYAQKQIWGIIFSDWNISARKRYLVLEQQLAELGRLCPLTHDCPMQSSVSSVAGSIYIYVSLQATAQSLNTHI
jgi:hypothetical protein